MPYTEPENSPLLSQAPSGESASIPAPGLRPDRKEGRARVLVVAALVVLLLGVAYAVVRKPTTVVTKNGITASLPYGWKYAWIDVPAELRRVVYSGVDIFYDGKVYDEKGILEISQMKHGTFLDSPPAGTFVSARFVDSSTAITPRIIAQGKLPKGGTSNRYIFGSNTVDGFASQIQGSYTGEAIVNGTKLLTLIFPKDRALSSGSPITFIVESFK
jgi:hypothetical protein